MVQTHAPPAFPRFTRFGRNVLDTWNEADQSNDCYLEAAIMLGVSLVAHEIKGDEGNIEPLTDVDCRLETELTRIARMQRSNDEIRRHSNNIGDEVQKVEHALQALLWKARAALKSLNVELAAERSQRSAPISWERQTDESNAEESDDDTAGIGG